MVYRCAKHIGGTIVLENIPPSVSDDYIREHCRESVEIPPDGVMFRGTLLSLSCPMLLGLSSDGKKIFVPFLKRCTGCVLIEIRATKKDTSAFHSLKKIHDS